MIGKDSLGLLEVKKAIERHLHESIGLGFQIVVQLFHDSGLDLIQVLSYSGNIQAEVLFVRHFTE